MRVVLLLAVLLGAGCLDGPFCSSARATFEGSAPGWLEALPPVPDDWQPTLPLGGPTWMDDGATITAPLQSGRPDRMGSFDAVATWFGRPDGGALFEDGRVRVFAHDAQARDRIIAAASDASETPLKPGAWATANGDEPVYWWDFALPDGFPRNSWVAATDAPQPRAVEGEERHLGWYAWGLGPARELRTDDAEIHLAPDRMVAYVHADDATEAELLDRLHALADRYGATVIVEESRYREQICTREPPET